jgi:hypothetical protein
MDDNDKSELERRYYEWQRLRARYAETDGEADGPSSSEWQGSDDDAVDLLHALAKFAGLAEPELESARCKHCERRIVLEDGTWCDPEATGDDRMWRETCGEHDTFTAEHEPLELEGDELYRPQPNTSTVYDDDGEETVLGWVRDESSSVHGHEACKRGVDEGRPWHAIPREGVLEGGYHFTTRDEAVAAVRDLVRDW